MRQPVGNVWVIVSRPNIDFKGNVGSISSWSFCLCLVCTQLSSSWVSMNFFLLLVFSFFLAKIQWYPFICFLYPIWSLFFFITICFVFLYLILIDFFYLISSFIISFYFYIKFGLYSFYCWLFIYFSFSNWILFLISSLNIWFQNFLYQL
jgi:hypothetical protein